MIPQKHAIALILSFIFLSCTVKIQVSKPDTLNRQQLDAHCRVLRQQYPQAFNLTQRITLIHGTKTYDFIGYLQVHANGDFSAVAAGEMGGTFVGLERRAGQVKITRNPLSLQENPLRDGVAGDIIHLFTEYKDITLTAGGYEGGFLKLFHQDSLRLARYVFDGDSLCASSEWVDNTLQRSVRYAQYRCFAGWPEPLPTEIELTNKKWHYQLAIQLLQFENSARREASK